MIFADGFLLKRLTCSAALPRYSFKMTAIVNYLQRRVFIANRSRIQYISDRRFSTRINSEQLNWRLAKASDFDDVVKLSEGIYNGYDFIPVVFHQWLKRENVAIMMLYADNKLIGLEAGHIVDDGKTLVRRGGRIAPNLRGQGLVGKMVPALQQYVSAVFPKVSRERISTFVEIKAKGVSPFRLFKKVLERDELSYFVEEKSKENFDRRDIYPWEVLCVDSAATKELEIESCTHEYFSDVILSSAETQKLFPNNILVFDWCPYEPLRSNIELIPEKNHRLYFFVEKCPIKGSPRSFSHGVHTQTVKAKKWEATVYTDDPAVFEAHLLYQFKLAREIIEGKFTFFSVQDRIMTPFARRVLGEILQLKEANFLNDETMKVYERRFIR